MDIYYKCKAFLKNLPIAIRFAWRFRTWDAVYAVEEFASNIETIAMCIRKNQHHIGVEKSFRKALFLSRLLRTYYADTTYYGDLYGKILLKEHTTEKLANGYIRHVFNNSPIRSKILEKYKKLHDIERDAQWEKLTKLMRDNLPALWD